MRLPVTALAVLRPFSCQRLTPADALCVTTVPSAARPVAGVAAQVTGEPMGRIVFEEARGLDGLKEAKLIIQPGGKSPFKMFAGPNGEGITLNIAVANGLGSAKKLIKVGVADASRWHNRQLRVDVA